MRGPARTELPPAPPQKTGWPWIERAQTPSLAPRDDPTWPRISIVMPSLNHGAFIEAAIRSVLRQDYPDLELIVVDGGSTDGCAETLARYGAWLTHQVCESDRGPADALN